MILITKIKETSASESDGSANGGYLGVKFVELRSSLRKSRRHPLVDLVYEERSMKRERMRHIILYSDRFKEHANLLRTCINPLVCMGHDHG